MKSMPIALHPKTPGVAQSKKPHNMSRFKGSEGEFAVLERLALSIFADCCNCGVSFNSALTAVLASGIDWGVNAKAAKE